jgi:hypothetical protein
VDNQIGGGEGKKTNWNVDIEDPTPGIVVTYVEFFDLVEACIEANLCETDLARQFFSPYANGHWLALKAQILGVRKAEAKAFAVDKPFGLGLEKLGGEIKAFQCQSNER